MAEDIGGVLVGLARRQGISEMLHRTAARVPGKLAIVGGQTRLTFAELEAAVSRTAAALAAEGLGKGDRLALLSHNCWQFAVLVVRDRPARGGLGAGQFHARSGARSPTSWATARRRRSWPRTGWPPRRARRSRRPGWTSRCGR